MEPIRTFKGHSKSLAHWQIQHHLKSLIPTLLLEKRVENRIADALWEEQKIVFEIQCSPLSLEEAQKRCHDYISLGYTPVWILHDRTFNHKSVAKAERFLRTKSPTYYTNGDLIYDQFDCAHDLKKVYQGPPLPINITVLKKAPLLLDREWPICFEGDLFHWAEVHDIAPFRKMAARCHRGRRFYRWSRIYKFLLYRILEKCC
jgi:competence protein CoiA-like protein